jgi:ABC-type maltose transport system permease subunit
LAKLEVAAGTDIATDEQAITLVTLTLSHTIVVMPVMMGFVPKISTFIFIFLGC